MNPEWLFALANHLWQSTIVVSVAGLLVLMLKRQSASLRYWVWFVASVKFLVPFSLLIGIGTRLEWTPISQASTISSFSSVATQVVEPFATQTIPHPPQSAAATTATWHFSLFAILVWVAGVLVIAACWIRSWFRMRAVVRYASPLAVGEYQAMVSGSVIEPSVFGILHPVLLLPKDIQNRLSTEQLRAVVAHEISHITRRDNLLSAIHMTVAATFWFYPLVWWLGARLLEERERACDDEVLAQGNSPETYAEGILRVCQLYLESPLPCAPGVSGSHLQRRIQRIVSHGSVGVLDSKRALILTTAAIALVGAPVLSGVFRATTRAQETLKKLSFEVASIRPNRSGDLRTTSTRPLPASGTYLATNQAVRQLIRQAYDLKPFQLEGGPKWIDDLSDERFDINAKAVGPVSPDELMLMLQSLLEDRFKLIYHLEARQLPIYALVIAKKGQLGPNLREPNPDERRLYPVRGGVGRMDAANATMQDLASSLSRVTGDRLVQDRTGLTGGFAFTLEYSPDPLFQPRPPGLDLPPRPHTNGPSIFQALQEQLGLKLEPDRGPVEIMIIDHLEKPSEN